MKIAVIYDPIFRARIYVTYGKFSELKEWYKRHRLREEVNPSWQALSERLTRHSGIVDYHMHFEFYGFTTIVHESHHTAFNILHDRGIPMVEETKETYAYYLNWIAGKCRDYLEKWTKLPG